MDVIGLSKYPLQDPLFKRYTEASKKMRTQDYMSFPVFDTDQKLAFCIQVTSKKKKSSNFSAGFTMFDEMFLGMAAKFLQIKLHQIIARREMK